MISPNNANANEKTALNHFYQQMITSDHNDLQAPSSSGLSQLKEVVPVLSKQHNSMENLAISKQSNSRNMPASNISVHVSPGPQSAAKNGRTFVSGQMKNKQEVQTPLLIIEKKDHVMKTDNHIGLTYRVMSEKRSS